MDCGDIWAPLLKTNSDKFVNLSTGGLHGCDPMKEIVRIRIARVDQDGVPVFVDA